MKKLFLNNLVLKVTQQQRNKTNSKLSKRLEKTFLQEDTNEKKFNVTVSY